MASGQGRACLNMGMPDIPMSHPNVSTQQSKVLIITSSSFKPFCATTFGEREGRLAVAKSCHSL